MAYSVPANPEWDLPGLLDKVPDLTKKAIAGGVFLGEIEDIADSDDVSGSFPARMGREAMTLLGGDSSRKLRSIARQSESEK